MSRAPNLIRYTYPEQLSSRQALQLTPLSSGAQADHPPAASELFTMWTELHPSRLLPAYAVQATLEVAQELQQAPSQQLTRVLGCSPDPTRGLEELAERGINAPGDLVFASPLIVEEAIVGERLSSLLGLARSRGWAELPVPFALGVFVSGARALAHLHALGFYHGALSSDSISIRYASPSPESPLSALQPQGGAVLSGWVQGNLFQLTPEAARYGRGPSADCRALLWTLLEMLGGAPSVSELGGRRAPTSCLAGAESEAQLNSPETQAALALLPQGFAAWVAENLRQPPAHMGAMLSQLQRALDPSQPAFNGSGLSRWVSRLAPDRVSQWELTLTDQEGQGLSMLAPPGGVLTVHARIRPHAKLNGEPQSVSQSVDGAMPAEDGQSVGAQGGGVQGRAPQAQVSNPASSQASPPSSSSAGQQKRTLSGVAAQAQAISTRLSQYVPDSLRERLPSLPGQGQDSGPRVRIATLWLDTITEIHDISLSESFTVGTADDVDLTLSPALTALERHTLITPGEGAISLAPLDEARGWAQTSAESDRQSLTHVKSESQSGAVELSLGGKCAITRGDFGLYIQVYQPERVSRHGQVLSSPESFGLIWSLFIAFFAHLVILLGAYGGREFNPQVTVVAKQERFTAMVEKIEEPQVEEPDEREPPQPPEEPTEYQEPNEVEPNPTAEYDRIEDQIQQLAQERFKGPEGARKLADAIAGDLELEGSLALGDVSSALSTAAEGGLALGSSFGDVGGQLDVGGGGGGSLNTSGGLKGAKGASSLRAKRVSRKIKGRVKTLRSRVRVRGGSLSQAVILKIINKSLARVNACYERQLIKSPNLSGKLTVSWVINKRGRVEKVKQVLASIRDAKLKQCVFGVIKRLKFPKPKGGTVKVKYPFIFQQG